MNPTTSDSIDEMRHLLITSVTEVFSTMFSIEVRQAAPCELRTSPEALVAGSVGFSGTVNGLVHIEVTADFARALASRMLGIPIAELEGDEMVNDVIGELSNMVVGFVKSHLCDAGSPCVLGIPSVVRGRNLNLERIRSSERRRIGFRGGEDYIQVDLLVQNSK